MRHNEHNETAHELARGFINRATPVANSPVEWAATRETLSTFGDILQHYKLGRRRFPPPHPDLPREPAVVYCQLQTETIVTLARLAHVCPAVYPTDTCRLCRRTRATAPHLLWDCEVSPDRAALEQGLPPFYEVAKLSTELATKQRAAQQILAALERQAAPA